MARKIASKAERRKRVDDGYRHAIWNRTSQKQYSGTNTQDMALGRKKYSAKRLKNQKAKY